MFNIPVSQNIEFSVVPGSEFVFREWGFSPKSFFEVVSVIGEDAPADIDVATTIKNYIASLGTATYDEFYVQFQIDWQGHQPWFSVSGDIPEATGDGLLLSESNLEQTTTLSFENLEQVVEGTFQAKLSHTVVGKKPTDDIEVIETIDYYIVLKRIAYSSVLLSPGTFNFTHKIGETLPSGQTLSIVSPGAFEITLDERLELSGGNVALDAEQPDEDLKLTRYTGTGDQDVTLALKSTIEDIGVTDLYEELYIEIVSDQGEASLSRCRIFLHDSDEFKATEESLSFSAVRGVEADTEKVFLLSGKGSFTISAPFWLGVTPSSGADFQEITVRPLDSENLGKGTLTGNIEINTDEGDIVIPVSYDIRESFDLGFVPKAINFTKDQKNITTVHTSSLKKVRLVAETLARQYNSAVASFHEFALERSVFGGKAKFKIGNIIDTVMYELTDLTMVGFEGLKIAGSLGTVNGFTHAILNYYNPSLTKVYFQLIDVGTGAVTGQSQNYIDIGFIKGRRPSRFNGVIGIIDAKDCPIRVTKKSYGMLNIYKSSGLCMVQIYRNNAFYKRFSLRFDDFKLRGIKFSFGEFTPGDRVSFKVSGSGLTGSSEVTEYLQEYIVFPNGMRSFHIAYEDEHGLIQLYEFTGDYTLKNKFDEVVSPSYGEFVDGLKKQTVDREITLNCNTGFTLRSNSEIVQAIVMAKRAWFVFEEGKSIALVPRSADIVSEDSSNELYAWELKFTINPKDEFEDFTF